MTARPFVIVGAGGHGRELLDIVDAAGLRGRFAGFVDDGALTGEPLERLVRRGAEVLGDMAWLADQPYDVVVGIGTSAVRRAVDAAVGTGREILSLQHPTAEVGSDVTLAAGTVLCARATVTTNVRIGRHTHVNVGCAVQHDSVLGDFVTLSPGVYVNGDVEIGDDVFVGTGALITRGCTVGAGAVIGAGAVVLRDVPAGAKVMGVPAAPR